MQIGIDLGATKIESVILDDKDEEDKDKDKDKEGRSCIREFRYVDAIELFTKVLDINPGLSQGYNFRSKYQKNLKAFNNSKTFQSSLSLSLSLSSSSLSSSSSSSSSSSNSST